MDINNIRLDPRPLTEFDDQAKAFLEMDVACGVDPRHRVFGYDDTDECIALVDLRPFDVGDAENAMAEAVIALTIFGATGLATTMPGRAWSNLDPIMPAGEFGDMRQRVLMLNVARRNEPVTGSVQPYDIVDGELYWHPAVDEPFDGWVPLMLDGALNRPIPQNMWLAAEAFTSCTELGHGVYLTPLGHTLMVG